MIYLKLLLVFMKIGALTFGGGYAMLPLITENTLKYGWASAEEIIDFIAVSESTPGPFAINMSTYIGSRVGGIAGAFCATLGVVLPSFIIILIVARVYLSFKENRFVAGCMSGLRPVVIGLIASAVVSIGKTVFFPNGFSFDVFLTKEFIISFIICISMLVLRLKKTSPILIVFISAISGIICGYFIL